MTTRAHQLPAALDVPAPSLPKAASNGTALPANKNDNGPEAMPAMSQVIDNKKADVSPANDTDGKIASCEDKDASKASRAGESAIPQTKKKEFTPSQAVQVAIDRCLAVRNASGSFMGWGERSEAAASASLDLIDKMSGDDATLAYVRQKLNEERKKRGERALNKSTTKELLAVFMCESPTTAAGRQECSRFANVVSVAVAEKRTPENVGAWLKATTLSEALEKAQKLKGKRSNKTYSIAITRNNYPHLWENFRTEAGRTAIAKALKSVDNSLKKATPDAR